MRSQDVHAMLRKPKHSAQTPLAAAAWETYLRDHFHACIKSCRPPPGEAAARSEGSCPESTHDMEVRPQPGLWAIHLQAPLWMRSLQTS